MAGGGTSRLASGDALSDALVRLRGVVVELVFSHHGAQVCLAEDEHAVEELVAQDASEAFAGRVHALGLDGGAQDHGAVCHDGVNDWVKFDRGRGSRTWRPGIVRRGCGPAARSTGQWDVRLRRPGASGRCRARCISGRTVFRQRQLRLEIDRHITRLPGTPFRVPVN
jgi:hypothetical protein